MESFTPWSALLGGGLIGLSASLLLWLNGRVAGISGIFEGLLTEQGGERLWRLLFVLGLALAGGAAYALSPAWFAVGVPKPFWVWVLGGALVGFGARLGGGCTSGHGVCGMSRLSPRSLVSVPTFIASGALAVWVSRAL